jgi:stearoyl-CoA desaturase (delta-9 desaturase)
LSVLAPPARNGTCSTWLVSLRICWTLIPGLGVHVALLGLFFFEPTPISLLLLFVLWLRGFGITVGYHRYFAHRSFRTSRPMQFLLAWIGCTCLQWGPLWWVAFHRKHHRYADTPDDPHSPVLKGFWVGHFGWLLEIASLYPDRRLVRDWMKFPELVWLDTFWMVPGLSLGVACFFLDGWSGVFWGFCLSSVVVLGTSASVNSFGHLFGSRRFATHDNSRNSLILGVLAGGEGWHNNHHRYPASAQQGIAWYELDTSYWVIRVLGWSGLIWNIRRPPVDALTPQPDGMTGPRGGDFTC